MVIIYDRGGAEEKMVGVTENISCIRWGSKIAFEHSYGVKNHFSA